MDKKTKITRYKEVYVWETPVRFYHWVNAFSVLILCITGYLIGNPPAILSEVEASFSYWFGIVRFIHFVTAYVFFFNFVIRIYWGFVGNKYAHWSNFVPFKKAQWKEVLDVIKIDIVQLQEKPLTKLGHNALASITYFLTFIAFILMSLTGFGIYAAMSDALFPKLFAWFVPLLGGDLPARQIHHILMWFFILFAIVHIYLTVYHDYVERHGVISSIIGGWKFAKEDDDSELISDDDVPENINEEAT